jgi:hypothetical protein
MFGWRDLISKGLVERRLLDDVKVTTGNDNIQRKAGLCTFS